MGKPTAAPPPSVTHFSHPHPLHLSDPQSLGQIIPCSACKLDASASASAVYACVSCNFALHPKCSQLPQQITHPLDEKHALTLYPKPVYPEGLFNCDACGNHGAGFSYHCSPCGIDLHTTCASLPLQLAHHRHSHALALTFSAPYPGNSFSCDICKKLGSKTWLYRCAACEFDVHLTCVAAVVPPPPPRAAAARSIARPPPPQIHRPNVGAYNGGVPPQAYGNAIQPGVYGGGRPANAMRDQIVLAAVEGVAQSASGALLQGLFGVGGGGGGAGGGGGNVICVDVMGGGSGAGVDGGSCYDGGYAAADGGYSGGDGSY